MARYSLPEVIQELETEIRWREHVFPARVAAKKMTPQQAHRRIAILQQVLAEYVRQLAREAPTLFGERDVPSGVV